MDTLLDEWAFVEGGLRVTFKLNGLMMENGLRQQWINNLN